jgi:exonuclease III
MERSGQIKKDKYSLYYSCSQQHPRQLGTGFMVKREIIKNIISFQPYNEKICKLRMRGKYHNLTLINMHAQTKDKDVRVKEQFYDDLQRMHENTVKHEVVIILGGLNAKIGKEQAHSQVSGVHTLHDFSNQNDEMVCNFAIQNNMIIMSTQYQHKRIHKGTLDSSSRSYSQSNRSCTY